MTIKYSKKPLLCVDNLINIRLLILVFKNPINLVKVGKPLVCISRFLDNIHIGKKLFECKECVKAFRYNSNLNICW